MILNPLTYNVFAFNFMTLVGTDAKRMTKAQRASAVRRERSKPQGVGGKPTNLATFAKRKARA